MIFATYLDGTYKVLLLFHIFAAIVGFGAVFTNKFYAIQAQKRPGPGGLAISEANYFVSKLAEYAIYSVPVTGLLLVWSSDPGWSYSDTWISLALLLYVIGLGLSHGVMFPGAKRINVLLAEMAAGPPPAGGPPPQASEVEAIGKRLGAVGTVLDLLLITILVLMIWKPGA